MREVVNLMGLPFDLCSMPEAVARMATAQEKNQRLFLSTPNVNFLINSLENAEFRRSIFASDLVVMDGMPLVWIAKLLGLKNAQRVAGSDLFTALDTHYRDMGKTLRVFFFGGRDGAAQAAHKAYADCTRGVKSVGYLNPGFGSVDDMSTAAIHETINAAKPDFVIVSLGAEKGQRWIMRNKCDLDAPLISHLGAVVDFCAGTVKRSPGFMSRLGLEWVWRIFQEPALWRRYWFDGFTLLKLLVLHVVPMIVRRTRQRPDGQHLRYSISGRPQDNAGALCIDVGNAAANGAKSGSAACDGDQSFNLSTFEDYSGVESVVLKLESTADFDISAQGQMQLFAHRLTSRGLKFELSGLTRLQRRQLDDNFFLKSIASLSDAHADAATVKSVG